MSTAGKDRVFLMYHELELPGRPLCQTEPGYVRYIVRAADFEKQMRWLKDSGWRGLSVTEALSSPDTTGVALTFDDGCETDLLTGAPLLRNLGFNATFYVTVAFLGKPGYLTRTQVRELADTGGEIGCHSMTHPYLSDLNDAQLKDEIVRPKQELEQMTGRAVDHFSCPGGRWNPRVAEIARGAGYRSVTTSRAAANPPGADTFSLGRVAIMRNTSLAAFQSACQGHGLWKMQLLDNSRAAAKQLLGNSGYDRVRALLLGRPSSKNQ